MEQSLKDWIEPLRKSLQGGTYFNTNLEPNTPFHYRELKNLEIAEIIKFQKTSFGGLSQVTDQSEILNGLYQEVHACISELFVDTPLVLDSYGGSFHASQSSSPYVHRDSNLLTALAHVGSPTEDGKSQAPLEPNSIHFWTFNFSHNAPTNPNENSARFEIRHDPNNVSNEARKAISKGGTVQIDQNGILTVPKGNWWN